MAKRKYVITAMPSAIKRTLNNRPKISKASGAPFQEQDPKRRLGNFVGTGEHARVGGRSKGIMGQGEKKTRSNQRTK